MLYFSLYFVNEDTIYLFFMVQAYYIPDASRKIVISEKLFVKVVFFMRFLLQKLAKSNLLQYSIYQNCNTKLIPGGKRS